MEWFFFIFFLTYFAGGAVSSLVFLAALDTTLDHPLPFIEVVLLAVAIMFFWPVFAWMLYGGRR